MSDQDRLSFQEACQELQISESALEQLVAQGEIASIKEGDTFFFKMDVIEQYKSSRKSDPSIILSDDELDLLDGVEEINLDDFEVPDEDAAISAGPGMGDAAAGRDGFSADAGAEEIQLEDLEIPEFSLDDGEIDADTESIDDSAALGAVSEVEDVTLAGDDELDFGADLEELSIGGADDDEGDDTILNLDGLLEDDGASEATTPVPGTDLGGIGELDLDDADDDITLEGRVTEDTILDTDVLELTDEDDELMLDSADDLTEGATSSLIRRGGGARVMQMKRVAGHPAWTAGLLVSAILMVLPIAVLLSVFQVDRKPEFSTGAGVSEESPLDFLRESTVRTTFESLGSMTLGLTDD